MSFAFFYIFLAWILLETYGHYDGLSVLVLAAGWCLTLLISTLPRPGFVQRRQPLLWKSLFSAAVLYFCATLWKAPGLVYPTSPALLSWLTGLLAVLFGVAAVFVAAVFIHSRDIIRIAFRMAVLLLLAARVLTLFVSPNPYIDVFTLTTRAGDALLSGLNPYTQTYADLYAGGYDYAPGLNYWPVYYLWSAPFRWLGDIRLGNILADALTLIMLLKLMAKFGVDDSLRYLVTLSWLSFPVSLFVLEQAWIEPVIVMLMTGLAWCGATKRWAAAGVILGLLPGLKQYMLLLSSLGLIYFHRQCARREFYKVLGWAAGVFIVTVAPFLIAGGQAFVEQTVLTYLQRGPRLDSLTLVAYLANEHGLIANNQLLMTIYSIALLVSIALMLWGKSTWQSGSLALFISYGVLFLLGKQAFCNYYYLLAFIALLCFSLALHHCFSPRRRASCCSLP